MNIRLSNLPAFSDNGNGRSTRDDRIAFQIDVLKFLTLSPSTTPTISMVLNASYRSTHGHLRALERAGLVTRERKGTTYWWRLA